MHKTVIISFILGAFLLAGCAGQAKTSTTYDETTGSEHTVPAEKKMPESPKMKADDMGGGG